MAARETIWQSYGGIIIAAAIGVAFYAAALMLFGQTQSRLVGAIAFLVVLWTNGALHMGIVSLLPILLFPLLGLVDSKGVVTNYSKDTIFLFIGGFLLAIATEKWDLHRVIADRLLSLFPKSPRGVLLSMMVTAALLSSILSNTTTALLLIPIAGFLTTDSDYRARLILGVAYACSIGGIITPVGTPPNLILMDFIHTNHMEMINFATWVVMMLPLAAVMLVMSAFILLWGFENEHFGLIKIETHSQHLSVEQRRLKYIFILIGLILAANPIVKHYFGVSANENFTIFTFGLFLFLPRVELLEWQEDFAKIPFAIVFLFGAGFAIAMAFQKTGLDREVADILLSFNHLSPTVLMLLVGIFVVFTTELTSNTALTAIMVPIIYPFALKSGLNPELFMLIVAISASYAFMLPIATPPNAIAMSTGDVRIQDMIRRGFWLNIIGILATFAVAFGYWRLFL